MIELRWLRRENEEYQDGLPTGVIRIEKVLQYKTVLVGVIERGVVTIGSSIEWSDWRDVPEEKELRWK